MINKIKISHLKCESKCLLNGMKMFRFLPKFSAWVSFRFSYYYLPN